MKNNTGVYIFAALVIIGITAFIFYRKSFIPKHSWREDFRKTSEKPYGLSLFYSTIKKISPETKLIYNQSYELLDTTETNTNFISIGNEAYFDSIAAMHLVKYVGKGNRALIASEYSPLEILRLFVTIGDTILGYQVSADSVLNVQFVPGPNTYTSQMRFVHQVLKDTVHYNWSVYSKSYFSDTLEQYNFKALSYSNERNVNSFYLDIGKGRLIVHSNPLLFTNYYFVTKDGFEHNNNILSQLQKGSVYWNDPYTFTETKGSGGNISAPSRNPLMFLFSHPYLKWAWYLFLITILLYLIFRSKREQRVIPIIPVNVNTTIEFTKAVGTLYFENKGRNHIANEMYTLFLAEIRSRYNFSTDIPENELIEKLSVRSGVRQNILSGLFNQFNFVRTSPDATNDDLVNLYNQIEKYHKKRK